MWVSIKDFGFTTSDPLYASGFVIALQEAGIIDHRPRWVSFDASWRVIDLPRYLESLDIWRAKDAAARLIAMENTHGL